jgi:two-component system nitrate/nitrite response regulator NarL
LRVLARFPDASSASRLRDVGRTALVVDDQEGFRRVARALLDAAGFTVVGEATDGADALTAVAALHPDVILLDVRLPDTSGLDVARTLRSGRDAPVVILTSTADYERAALACGAAFIAKVDLSAALVIAAAGAP